MGRSGRQHWARVCVQGLLQDGERKFIKPVTRRIDGASVQFLRQFVGQSRRATGKVQRRLAEKVIDILNELEVWMI